MVLMQLTPLAAYMARPSAIFGWVKLALMWTHIFDLFVKGIVLLCSTVFLEYVLDIDAEQWLVITSILALSVVLYYAFFRTLGSYLYGRIRLRMPLSWRQAQSLNKALSPVFSTEWLPMKEVKEVEMGLRYPTALELCNNWTEERTQNRQEHVVWFQNLDALSKAVNVVFLVLALALMAASIFNVAPASYVTDAYCAFFDTDEYYPMLNMLVLLLPLLGMAFLLSKLGIKFKK